MSLNFARRGGWQRNLLVVWLSQFMSMVSFSAAYTFIPFYFEQLGVTGQNELSRYVSYFAAAGNLTFCIFAPIWGLLADVYGRRMMLLRANFGAAALVPLMAVISSPDLLVCHRLLLGALTGTVTAAQTLVLSTTPTQNRSFALGSLASALFGGMMCGQFLGGNFVAAYGFDAAFFGGGVLLFLSGLLILGFARENFERTESLAHRLRRIPVGLPRFGVIWYLLFLFLYMGLAREFDGPFLPLLVKEVMNGSPEALRWSGWISAACSLAGVISGLVIGFLADRTPLLRLAGVVISIAGVMRIMQSFAPTVEVLMFERVAMVLAAGGMEPLFQAWLAASTRESEHGLYFGWAACAKAVGWICGSLLGGQAAQLFGGVRGVFFVSGLMYFVTIVIMNFTAHRVAPPNVSGDDRRRRTDRTAAG